MSEIAIQQVLAQIRAARSELAGIARPPAAPGATGEASFADLLKRGIDQVNQTQANATHLATAFEQGQSGVELGQVMIEAQKATVSFRALVEVRNRFVAAYQEIMNMPI